MFQNSDIHWKNWVSVPCFKVHVFIGKIWFQLHVSCFKTEIFIRNIGLVSYVSKLTYSSETLFHSYVSKLTYSSETLGFNHKFQNSDIHRIHWVSAPCFKTRIFIRNTGFQTHVSIFITCIFIVNTGISLKFQNSYIHRKCWVSVPYFKTHIFIGKR